VKPNNPIECRGIDHVVLRVTDIERSLHFYNEILGLPLERVIEDIGVYQLRCGPNLIDLSVLQEGKQLAEKDARGIDHLCLTVHGDVDTIVSFVKEQGIPITFGPVELYGATGYGTSIYVLDPDGHTLELKADYPQWAVRTTAAEAMGGMTRPKP
jgi:catechol 2,3-dioxygenase-like lactoylglutathione lyase family enzyme